MDISDGSSDEDSDYGSVDAARDQDEEILEVEENKNERGLQKINPRRRRDVEDTWAALKAIDMKSVQETCARAFMNNNNGLFTSLQHKAGISPKSTAYDCRKWAVADPSPVQKIKEAGGKNKKKTVKVVKAVKEPVKAAPLSSTKKLTKAQQAAADKAIKDVAIKKKSLYMKKQFIQIFGRQAAKKMLKNVVNHSKGIVIEPWDNNNNNNDNVSKPKSNKTTTTSKNSKKVGNAAKKASPKASSASASASVVPDSNSNTKVKIKVDKNIKLAVTKALKNVARKTVVIETRKFAGRNIEIERTQMLVKSQFDDDDKAAAAEATAAANKKQEEEQSGGLDSLLDTIKGPKVINTVSKSAFDWETHKTKEGLEDDLAVAGKGGGYLGRSDFLQRVDVRTYEKERDARVLAQASGKKKK
jgi:hypothetical protein